jgi:hypothetical protein
MDKIVVHNKRGRVMKGRVFNFSPNQPGFEFLPLEGELREVSFNDLKAVFFVRDFEGDASYNEDKSFTQEKDHYKCRIEVRFKDGEVLVGATMSEAGEHGFFLFPPDEKSNNLGLFCVSAAVESVRKL